VEQVPARGGAILVANHISYADAAVLQIACRRPIRFVGYHGYKTHWFFGFVFRLAGVILISPERPRAGLRRAIDALKAGEIVCVFPEGAISRIGQLMRLHRGFVVMARSAEVPVIPVSVDGLWGSVFSFSGDKYLWKPPRIMPTDVFVAFGGPIPPGKADMDGVRSALLDLGAEAFRICGATSGGSSPARWRSSPGAALSSTGPRNAASSRPSSSSPRLRSYRDG
jgi:acyl-[acyl-carrier-protein]-phospholipid O-acyltransferase/long-chain-fatty-acid--[acyl-carrier-protein] ligase